MGAFRRGAIIGFAAGYVKGSKAGRERYEQINKTWKKVKKTPGYQRVAATAGDVVGMGLQRGKLVAMDAVGRASHKIKSPGRKNGAGHGNGTNYGG